MTDSGTDPAANVTVSAGTVQPDVLELPAGEHRLCRCGLSRSWPVCEEPGRPDCDGGEALTLKAPRWLWLCRCGRSREPPYCDGTSHSG